MTLADHILHRVRGHGRGHVFGPRDFLDLGGRAGVDQALTRLADAGTIRRIDRGLYDLPRFHPKIGLLWPSAAAVALAIARQTGSRIKDAGPLAANALGLSTQVPATVAYLTDGPSRTVHVGRLRVSLRHAGRVDMLLPDCRAGLVIVALKYLGRDAATPALVSQVAAQLDAADRQQLRASAWRPGSSRRTFGSAGCSRASRGSPVCRC